MNINFLKKQIKTTINFNEITCLNTSSEILNDTFYIYIRIQNNKEYSISDLTNYFLLFKNSKNNLFNFNNVKIYKLDLYSIDNGIKLYYDLIDLWDNNKNPEFKKFIFILHNLSTVYAEKFYHLICENFKLNIYHENF